MRFPWLKNADISFIGAYPGVGERFITKMFKNGKYSFYSMKASNNR
jgi:hypothetical protein